MGGIQNAKEQIQIKDSSILEWRAIFWSLCTLEDRRRLVRSCLICGPSLPEDLNAGRCLSRWWLNHSKIVGHACPWSPLFSSLLGPLVTTRHTRMGDSLVPCIDSGLIPVGS